jgi:hypothetical protein
MKIFVSNSAISALGFATSCSGGFNHRLRRLPKLAWQLAVEPSVTLGFKPSIMPKQKWLFLINFVETFRLQILKLRMSLRVF